jgi:hypothetical protein
VQLKRPSQQAFAPVWGLFNALLLRARNKYRNQENFNHFLGLRGNQEKNYSFSR